MSPQFPFSFWKAGVTISNISSTQVSTSSQTVIWTTNIAANSQVFFGTTPSLGNSSTLDPTLVTSHSVTLTALSPNTLYYFTVKSGSVTSPQSTFTTEAGSGATITSITFWAWVSPGDVPLTVDWSIDSQEQAFEPAGGNVNYGSNTGVPITPTLEINGNADGYDVYSCAISLDPLSLGSGSYWLTLQNAFNASGDPVFWDVNSGPSLCYTSADGAYPSCTFEIDGDSGDIYDNGAPDGNDDARAISNGFIVSNSFNVA